MFSTYIQIYISNLFSSGHKQFDCLHFTIVGGGGGEKWAGPFLPHPQSKILIVLCYQFLSKK